MSNALKLRDTGYRFRNRDPILDEICQIITASNLTPQEISQQTAKLSSRTCVSPNTILRWLDGATKRPQNFTLDWVAFVLGYERGHFKPIETSSLKKERK